MKYKKKLLSYSEQCINVLTSDRSNRAVGEALIDIFKHADANAVKTILHINFLVYDGDNMFDLTLLSIVFDNIETTLERIDALGDFETKRTHELIESLGQRSKDAYQNHLKLQNYKNETEE